MDDPKQSRCGDGEEFGSRARAAAPLAAQTADPQTAVAPTNERAHKTRMTAEELAAFAAQVRAECDDALARMATVDATALPPDLRRQFEEQRQRWVDLRALTESDALELHEAAAKLAGRELTQAEARALLKRQ
jgi:hypothetical protein